MIPIPFSKSLAIASMIVAIVAVLLAIVGFVTDPNRFVTSLLPLVAGSAGVGGLQMAVASLIQA